MDDQTRPTSFALSDADRGKLARMAATYGSTRSAMLRGLIRAAAEDPPTAARAHLASLPPAARTVTDAARVVADRAPARPESRSRPRTVSSVADPDAVA